jgi:type IV pilus assembly protein PilA
MKKLQKGFTLIELMIVVAIIAILAAIAISQYQDYVIRSQVSEGSSLADGTKTAVAEFVNNYGRYADNNASYGLSLPTSITGKYVTQVDVGNPPGKIEVTFGKAAHANIATKLLVFSPITHAGSIEWSCNTSAGTTVDSKYRPTPCRD